MHNFTSSFIRHSNGSIIFRSIEIFTLRILERIAQFSEGGKMGISIDWGRAFANKYHAQMPTSYYKQTTK